MTKLCTTTHCYHGWRAFLDSRQQREIDRLLQRFAEQGTPDANGFAAGSFDPKAPIESYQRLIITMALMLDQGGETTEEVTEITGTWAL